jgi:hypothetical protein
MTTAAWSLAQLDPSLVQVATSCNRTPGMSLRRAMPVHIVAWVAGRCDGDARLVTFVDVLPSILIIPHEGDLVISVTLPAVLLQNMSQGTRTGGTQDAHRTIEMSAAVSASEDSPTVGLALVLERVVILSAAVVGDTVVARLNISAAKLIDACARLETLLESVTSSPRVGRRVRLEVSLQSENEVQTTKWLQVNSCPLLVARARE